ncbi:MAG: FAD-binding protein [Candidatus Helarchaeota archaeon]
MHNNLISFLQSNNIQEKKLGSGYKIPIKNKEQILLLLKFANSESIPIIFNYSDKIEEKKLPKEIPFLFLTFDNFDRIDEINITNRYAIVQPMVMAKKLSIELKADNFCFSPHIDENMDLNIGQIIFKNFIGSNNVKTVDCVLGLEIILPDGKIINTGSKTLKSVSGYDVTSLYIGSQGIFGIVTKAILRIDPLLKYSIEQNLEIIKEDGFNEGELIILQKLKNIIDPNNILNPGFLI